MWKYLLKTIWPSRKDAFVFLSSSWLLSSWSGKEIGAWKTKNTYSKSIGFNWGKYFKIL